MGHGIQRCALRTMVGLLVSLAGTPAGAVTVSVVTTHPNLGIPSSEVFSLIADCPFRPAMFLSILSVPSAAAVSMSGTQRLLNTAATGFDLSASEFRFSFDHTRGDGQFTCSDSLAGDSARSVVQDTIHVHVRPVNVAVDLRQVKIIPRSIMRAYPVNADTHYM